MPTIRIHSHSFILSDPYSAGVHPVGPRELAALDRLRAENIRNNAAKKMNKGEWPLAGQALQDFQTELAQMDEEYEFPKPLEGSARVRPGAFESLVREIAEDWAYQGLQRGGRVQPSEAEVQEASKVLLSDPEVQAEARRRLEVKSQVALEVLEEMLG